MQKKKVRKHIIIDSNVFYYTLGILYSSNPARELDMSQDGQL